jgi:hypothetical protein
LQVTFPSGKKITVGEEGDRTSKKLNFELYSRDGCGFNAIMDFIRDEHTSDDDSEIDHSYYL